MPKNVREELEAIVDQRLQKMSASSLQPDRAEVIRDTQEAFREILERLLIEKVGSFRLRDFQSLFYSTGAGKAAYRYARRYLKPADVVPKALEKLRANLFGGQDGRPPRLPREDLFGKFPPTVPNTATGALLHIYGYELKGAEFVAPPTSASQRPASAWNRGDRLGVAQIAVAVIIGLLAIAATLFPQELRHFLFAYLGLGSGP